MKVKLIVLNRLKLSEHELKLPQTGPEVLLFGVGHRDAVLEPGRLKIINGGVVFMLHEEIDQFESLFGVIQVKGIFDR